MKQCPNCGAQIADDSRFCAECGKEVAQGTVCPHCGENISEGDAFCQNCGKKPTDNPIEDNEAVYEEEAKKKSGFKKYLPYIIGAVVVLAIIGYFSSMDSKGGGDAQTVAADTMAVDSVASADEAPMADKNRVIADYDKGMIYQGEYVFDAVLTDATLEKNNATFIIKINGNNVTSPMDEGKVMSGHIYNDDLGIEAVYDYGDDLHWISLTIRPNDKEGKEWVGEYAFTGMRFDAVLKLKECKLQGEAIKVTKEREAENNDESEEERNLDWLQGHWVYEQGNYKGHFIIQGDKITQYSSMNPERETSTFRIEGDEILSRIANGVNLAVKIDFANHTIDYGDGCWMHKIE
jgi:hypothetical protein